MKDAPKPPELLRAREQEEWGHGAPLGAGSGAGPAACKGRSWDDRQTGRWLQGARLGPSAVLTALPSLLPGPLHGFKRRWSWLSLSPGAVEKMRAQGLRGPPASDPQGPLGFQVPWATPSRDQPRPSPAGTGHHLQPGPASQKAPLPTSATCWTPVVGQVHPSFSPGPARPSTRSRGMAEPRAPRAGS